MRDVTLITDGGCWPNPGPGGWAYILRCGNKYKESMGYDSSATNNRMEIIAVIEGLRSLKTKCKVNIITDSTYVLWGISKLIESGGKIQTSDPKYRRRSGKTSELKNLDLWTELAELIDKHDIVCTWTRGHNGNEDNERCDQLATIARTKVESEYETTSAILASGEGTRQ
jgi:ribonuclease HI